jgi:hypothetical protein
MRYTKAQLQFIEQGYKTMRIPDLTNAFNKHFDMNQSAESIRYATKNHKFACTRKPGFKKGENLSLAGDQVQWLIDNYPTYSGTQLTEEFNRIFDKEKKKSQIIAFLKNHGIRSGRDSKFGKGHVSWNAGSTGLTSANITSFKKGSVPANIKPLGHERICTKDGYILIKIPERNPHTGAPTRYKAKHIVLWEAEHGPAPDGYIITFIDGDKLNLIDNLECISKQENVRRNKMRISSLPDELKPTARLVAKLTVQAHKMDKEQ